MLNWWFAVIYLLKHLDLFAFYLGAFGKLHHLSNQVSSTLTETLTFQSEIFNNVITGLLFCIMMLLIPLLAKIPDIHSVSGFILRNTVRGKKKKKCWIQSFGSIFRLKAAFALWADHCRYLWQQMSLLRLTGTSVLRSGCNAATGADVAILDNGCHCSRRNVARSRSVPEMALRSDT